MIRNASVVRAWHVVRIPLLYLGMIIGTTSAAFGQAITVGTAAELQAQSPTPTIRRKQDDPAPRWTSATEVGHALRQRAATSSSPASPASGRRHHPGRRHEQYRVALATSSELPPAIFSSSDVTLQRSRWHLIQIAGEANADYPVVKNCILRDAYEQMLKVTLDPANPTVTSDNGLVENCIFEYTAGVGPQYYIGGIDAHGAKNWVVRETHFETSSALADRSPNSRFTSGTVPQVTPLKKIQF